MMKNKILYKLLTIVLILGAIFFIVPLVEDVNAATAGPNNGSTFNTGASPFGGTVGWTNVANVQTSNSVYAVTSSSMVNTTNSTTYSLEILTTGFGFSIPANAVINSVTVGIQSMKSNATTGDIYAYIPRMIVDGTRSNTVGGSIYPLTTSPNYISYTFPNNSSSEKNNFPVTPAQVNASNFGVAWSFYTQSADSVTVSVDHVRISIDYTVPAAPSGLSQDPVTSKRPTSALLVGHLQSNALSTTGYFKWGTTNTGNCSTLANTTSSVTLPASGSQNNAFSYELTGLTAGQTYYYCAVGNNTSGTTHSSSISSFIPPPASTVSGPNNPSSSTTSGPWQNWSNTANIYASDGVLATNTSSGNYPNYLQAWGFGFSIPAGATITGVVVDVKGSYNTSVLSNGYVMVYKNAGSMVNHVLNISQLPINAISQYLTGGSSTNLTPGALTPAEVNNNSFGIVIWNNGQIWGTFSVDHARMTIYYQLTPSLSTPTKASITTSGATLGATVTSDSGAALSERGICWAATATNSNPQIGGTGVTCVAEGGTAVSTYTQVVTGMPSNTPITYQGYATNTNGTGYSGTDSFTTLTVSVPTLSTPTKTTPTDTTITLGATVSSDGGAALTARGVCYSLTSQDSTPGFTTAGGSTPEANVTCTNEGSTTTGIFTIPQVTGLTPSTAYTYRGFARNSVGNGYSSADSFTTYGSPSTTTSAASSITASQAILNSTINPNGASTNVSYLWGTTPGVDCDLQPNTLAGPTALTGTSNLSGATTQATLSSLSGNTTYYFCVMATNTYGTNYGSVTSFTTSPNTAVYTYMPSGSALGGGATDCQDNANGAPCAPTSTSASAASTSQINLSWGVNSAGGAVPAVTSYDVYKCGLNQSGCSSPTISNVSSATFAFNDTSLTCSTSPSYYYRIVAKNANGNTQSSIFSGTTSTCGPVFTIVNSNNGYGTDIAMGSDGYARIAYQDALDNSLKFVQCTNAACTTKNITTVDSIGYHISMKLGSDGYARIAYWDNINDDLKFVQCTNAACTTKNITTVDSTGATGRSPKVDIGSDGYARIAYQYSSSPNVSIKFVQCTNAACTTKNISTVDTFVDSGTVTGMALGSDDYARISYRNAGVGLRFVQCTNASCSSKSVTTIDSNINLGGLVLSVEKGSDGFMRIGASDGTIIKFIQCTNAACTTNANNTVYSDSGILYGSMKLGSDGYGRIGYYQSVSQDVKFIQCTNATCTTKNITTVDSTGNTGQGLSSTIGSDGFARIAYRDDLANLKLAICQSASCQ